MFLKSCRWKWKETPTRDFLSYQKRISPTYLFIVLQLSAKDFRVRAKGRAQQHYKKLKQIRYFKIINISECWCEIGYTSEGSIINQSWITNFPLLHFSKLFMDNFLCLCDVWKGRSYVNVKFSASSIFNNG